MKTKKICLDCDCLYDACDHEQCPDCGSSCYWWYTKFVEVKKLQLWRESNERDSVQQEVH